ncbi:MAG TPA: PEGA domain-containing protein [Polyangiaceae bacterium]
MRTRVCLAALFLVTSSVVLGDVPTAAAQEKDAVTETARRRFQEGVKFFDQKRYEEARAAFLQAYALKHHPAVLLNLAQSEIRSGHPLEAARHFSGYLRESTSASPVERGEAEKGLATARAKLGKIQVSVAAGAEVVVDGEAVGQAPLPEPVDVLPGNHSVEAKLGGRTATASVSVAVGKSANASLSLEPVPVAPAPAPAPGSVGPSSPPATVPDSSDMRGTEASKDGAPPGSDTGIRVSTGGREPFFKWLGHNGVGIVGLSITVIGIGVFVGGAIFAKQANDNADNVAEQIRLNISPADGDKQNACAPPVAVKFQDPCTILRDNLDKRDTDRTVATIGAVAAGVGFTATIAAYFLSSKSGEPSQAHVAPLLGPKQAGIAVVGSF